MREFDHLRPSIAEEPYAFFGEVLNSNLSILNFIDSDFVMINPTLNSLYQIEGFPEKSYKGRGKKKKVKGKKPAAKTVEEPVPEVGWTKVSLNESDTVRGGFVSQAGILLMTTNGEFTNPFYRGAWVIKSLYGDDLETPADLEVGTLKPTTEASTIKENIRLHREDASCSVCHVKMDPFGLALENYDIIGRWRENYRITQGKKTATRPVESGVEHMDRRKFSGPAGVKKIMLEDKEKITRAFIKKVFVYAMARETTYIDRDHLERTYQECVKNGYRLQDLLVDIVASKSFAKR